MSKAPNPDACAVGSNGELLDAEHIEFYASESEQHPIQKSSIPGPSKSAILILTYRVTLTPHRGI